MQIIWNRGSKSRNKVSVGEPADGSLLNETSRGASMLNKAAHKNTRTQYGLECPVVAGPACCRAGVRCRALAATAHKKHTEVDPVETGDGADGVGTGLLGTASKPKHTRTPLPGVTARAGDGRSTGPSWRGLKASYWCAPDLRTWRGPLSVFFTHHGSVALCRGQASGCLAAAAYGRTT